MLFRKRMGSFWASKKAARKVMMQSDQRKNGSNKKKNLHRVNPGMLMIDTEGGTWRMGLWRREDIPYDAMGDYSAFDFSEEESDCEDQDRNEELTLEDQ